MQPKKNPKVDLAKSSGLSFATGFVIVSGLSLWGFGAKMYDKAKKDDRQSELNKLPDEDQEDSVVEAPDTPSPPPPPPAPTEVQDVEVVDNKANIQEQAIASNEIIKEEKVAEIKDIKLSEPVDDIPIDVPFTIIEDKPMFDAYENEPKDRQLQCLRENLDKHVSKNFVYPPAALEMGIQGKVNVSFRINVDGTIIVLDVRGTDKPLEAEAKRIIEELPKLIPGKQRGKPTPATSTYPISFKLQS